MGNHPEVLKAMQQAVKYYGAGAGGTRNIAGNSPLHLQLEKRLANWHHQEAALVFTSGYVANEATLSTLAQIFPGITYFSDSKNHASMITGIAKGVKMFGGKKQIFQHNDTAHLESLLKECPIEQPKVIVFESVYSMSGDISPVKEMVKLAKKYNALTYLDEVHAVGLYGNNGAGIAQQEDVSVDILQGTLAKAIGVCGGYIAGKGTVVDCIRSMARGFIFTTALSPVLAAAADKSIALLQNTNLREQHQQRVQETRQALAAANIPLMPSPSHIIPVKVGDARRCKAISDYLLQEKQIYLQPINYPTVEKGAERLRITPSPFHTIAMIKNLTDSLQEAFQHYE